MRTTLGALLARCRFRRTETAMVIGLAALIVVLALTAWRAFDKLHAFIGSVDETHHYSRLVSRLDAVMAGIARAEGEQAAFLLMREPVYLARYQAALGRVHAGFETLRPMSHDDPLLDSRLTRIKSFTAQRIRLLAQALEHHRGGNAEAALDLLMQGRSVGLEIGKTLEPLYADYDASFAAAREKVKAFEREVYASFVLTALLAGAIVVLMCAVAIADVRWTRALSNELRHESRHDSLTGLPNRLYLDEHLERVIARAKRRNVAFGMLYVDLNGFKRVNDSLGHSEGDKVLVEIARKVKASARATDFVARLGGDEFVVMLSDVSNPAQAEKAAGRFRRIAAHRDALVVTASVGYALFPRDGHDIDALIRASDAAMYANKRRQIALDVNVV